jgi:hypothetical protein
MPSYQIYNLRTKEAVLLELLKLLGYTFLTKFIPVGITVVVGA